MYRDRSAYVPAHGDFVIWTGWWTTWHGIVSNYNLDTGELDIIFSNIPYLLFNMDDAQQKRETIQISLAKIKNSLNGTWAIQQHDAKSGATIWYI